MLVCSTTTTPSVVGSRAICFSKRTLEIFDRLGCGERMVAKGVGWNVGKVFFPRRAGATRSTCCPETGHRRPAFINLQQYYVEEFLVERARELPQAELRWQNKVVGVAQQSDEALSLRVETPDGEYVVHADWLIAADGARSPIRGMLGSKARARYSTIAS